MIVKKFVPDPKDHFPQLRKEWNDWCWRHRPKIRTLLKKASRAIMEGDTTKARKLTWDALEAIEDFNRFWVSGNAGENVVLKDKAR